MKSFLTLFWFGLIALSSALAQQSAPSAKSSSGSVADRASEALRRAQKDGSLEKVKDQAKGLIKQAGGPATILRQAAGQLGQQPVGQMLERVVEGAGSKGSSSKTEAAGAPQVLGGRSPSQLPPLGSVDTEAATAVGVIESDQSDFDLNRSLFIYRGNVRARHPEFYIECEELEVEMIRDPQNGKPGAKVAAPPSPAAKASGSAGSGGAAQPPPIRRAVASGPMVVIEKRSVQGDIQQGRCRRLEYDGKTGDIILREYPQVQKGNVLHVATTPDTYMIFDRAGNLRTIGRPRTVILNEGQPKAP
jgi:hypothetical protein